MSKPLSQVSFPTRRAFPHMQDAPEPMVTGVVWKKHIKGSTVCDRHNCPLQRSVVDQEQHPDVEDALITDYRAFVQFKDGRLLRYTHRYNKSTQKYDWNGAFTPGNYILDAPRKSERIGKKRGSPIGGAQAQRTKRSLR